MLESHLDDAIALGVGVFLREFVFHDVNADHQAAAAHVADQLQFFRPIGHALQDVVAHAG